MIWNTKIVEAIKDNNLMDNGLLKSNPFYKNNLNVKKPYLKYHFTEQELINYKSSKDDIFKFVSLLNIELFDYQKDLLMNLYNGKHLLVKKSRQIGCSLVQNIYILYCLTFEVDYTILLLHDTKSSISYSITKIKELYENYLFS